MPIYCRVKLLASALLLASLMAIALATPAPANDETPRQVVNSARSVVTDIDNALKGDNLSDSELARLRELNDPLVARLQGVILDLAPRLEASRRRLIELTPKTTETTNASDQLTDEQKAEQAKHDTLDADLRTARALLLQTDEDAARIGSARRELFAKQTFARSSSVLSPFLWIEFGRETPRNASIIFSVVSEWARGLEQRLSVGQVAGFLTLTLVLVGMVMPARWIASRVTARDAKGPPPNRLRRALAAAGTTLVLAGLPLALLGAFSYSLDFFDISDPQMQGFFDAALDGLRLIALANAFGRGLLAPGEGHWRLFSLGERATALIFRFLMFTAAVWAAERLLEAVAEATASLDIAVASRALGATLIGLAGAGTLQRVVDPQHAPPPGRDPWAPARTLAWAFVAILVGAAGLGYIAFAAFLVNQTLFVCAVGGSLYLADALVQESAEQFLKPQTAFGRGLMTIIGLSRDTMEQIVVIAQGFARLAALVTAIVVAFAPLGLPSQDIASTARTAYFGVTIGGVTISLSTLIAAAFVFVVGVVATRAAQNWLSDRYLPRTRLDPSVSHSISAITGYVGLVIALMLAGGRLGLDMGQFTIVAGALSVGIGFGLQGIVNNFVAGLILFWERRIRVGDWVVVGSEEGFVRRINARATEIETFERSTLIVPNSTLVTTPVKNWILSDRVARVLVALNVDFAADPEKVRELLIASARAQNLVLAIPAPLVVFKEIGDWALKFELVCYVDDALIAYKVQSELNFDILKRLRETEVKIAAPYPRA